MHPAPAPVPPDLQEFFQSYAAAFQRLDAAAVAEHFAFPVHVIDDDEGTEPRSVPDSSSWKAALQRLIELYRRIELGSARSSASVVAELAPGLLLVRVDWQLLDRAGHDLYSLSAVYTIKRLPDGLRIIAIAHNEPSRSRAFLK